MELQLKVKEVERISKALGETHRLQVIDSIKKRNNWTRQTEIIQLLDLSQSSVSHHLKQLLDSNLIIARKVGREMSYKVDSVTLKRYINYLTELFNVDS